MRSPFGVVKRFDHFPEFHVETIPYPIPSRPQHRPVSWLTDQVRETKTSLASTVAELIQDKDTAENEAKQQRLLVAQATDELERMKKNMAQEKKIVDGLKEEVEVWKMTEYEMSVAELIHPSRHSRFVSLFSGICSWGHVLSTQYGTSSWKMAIEANV